LAKVRIERLSLIGCATLVVAFLLTSQLVIATDTLVWSDDFEDGDYDGWTVQSGGFEVSGGVLRANLDPHVTEDFNLITHPSAVGNGTWTFDVLLDDSELTSVWFMSAGDHDGVALCGRECSARFPIDRIAHSPRPIGSNADEMGIAWGL